MIDDNTLLKRIKNNDDEAFDELFKRYYASMCVVARNITLDDYAAKDLAQDTFIKFWNKRANYDSITSIKTFLYVLTKNNSLSYIRSKKTKEEINSSLLQNQYGFNNLIIEEETYRILYQAIDSLAPQTANVIKLKLKGLQNQDIADELNISINTVKTLRSRALKTLKDKLKDYFMILIILLSGNV